MALKGYAQRDMLKSLGLMDDDLQRANQRGAQAGRHRLESLASRQKTGKPCLL